MKEVLLGNTTIEIKPLSFAAVVKVGELLREAGLDRIITGEDVIKALKQDPDILHKLAAVYYLNDAESLARWAEVWREWADRFAPLQMLPIISAGVTATSRGIAQETLSRWAVLRALEQTAQTANKI